MSETIYKPGDKVAVRSDLSADTYYRMTSGKAIGYSVRPGSRRVDRFKGKIVTISKRNTRGAGYCVLEDPSGYAWTDEMFEPVSSLFVPNLFFED